MTITAATPTMLDWSRRWETAIPSAKLSGINGDAAHQSAPGKHLSRSDNVARWGSGCWPVVHPRDKLGPGDKSCAIDMNMDRRDQNLVHSRFIEVYRHRHTDPRAAYVFAFNGWNGVGSPMRYNLTNGATAVTDDSHTWHEHVETFYCYVNDPKMVDAMMSIITGESVASYIGRTVKKDMAIELNTLLGGDTGHSGRTVQQFLQDLQNARNFLVGETHPAALRQAPAGSPLAALKDITALRKEVEQLRALVVEVRDLVKPTTAPK